MIGLYLAGLATGGVLLLLSVLGGGDADADDVDVDVDADVDADHPDDVDAGSSSPMGALALAVFPVASLRFWTFFFAFGGLAGTLLTALSSLGTVGTAVLAGVLGYAAAVGAAALMRAVSRETVTSSLGASECVGTSGTVLLPIASGSRGRVRIRLEGQVVDFDAESEEDLALAVSEPVFVYAIRDDGVALVASLPPKLQPSS